MTDDDLRALQEQAHMLYELSEHPGWAVYVDYLETVTRSQKMAVLNGNVTDFERYKSITGELLGIHKALNAPRAVATMVAAELDRRREANDANDTDAA
jgi:hypothetical protein